MIPFSPPYISQEMIDAVCDTLRSGWITTGPKTRLFEQKISEYCGTSRTLCLNSATAGLELALRWFGIGPGDEVILPAYTYAATANVIEHCGAKPVFADVLEEDFCLDPNDVARKITSRTKVIMPVDFGGFPCDYSEFYQIVKEFQPRFTPSNPIQEKLNRILILSDAAHSFGAEYEKRKTGTWADITVFSFHAVKNLTTAEGGAMTFFLPSEFNTDEVWNTLVVKSLHGQSKDALSKLQPGNWRYDIVEPGYKYNMTDIAAAIGLEYLKIYDQILEKRKKLFDTYCSFLQEKFFILPPSENQRKKSSFHLFPLRIREINEEKRNLLIQKMANSGISTNVHFVPVPMMSYYKNKGYSISDYPVSYKLYASEITLPLYYQLREEEVELICTTLKKHVQELL